MFCECLHGFNKNGGLFVVLLGEALNSPSESRHKGYDRLAPHPGGVELLLVLSCCMRRNRDKPCSGLMGTCLEGRLDILY